MADLQPTDLDAFAQDYQIAGAVPPPPPKPSKGNSFDFSRIVVQSEEDFARLPESQKQLLRNMKQGIQYTPQAAAEFVETFNTRLMEQSTPKAQAEIAKASVDLEKSKLDVKKAEQEIAATSQKKQAVASEISSMRNLLSQVKEHDGLATSVGAKGGSYLFGLKKEPFSGTEAADFYTLLEQVQGGTFMQAFNNLKGGGQITEQEGAKATAALARLNPRQSEEGFKKALIEFDGILAGVQTRTGLPSPAEPNTNDQPAPPPPPQFRSKEEVIQATNSGQLSREQAAAILRTQFGNQFR